jgi:hypothetical protein
MKRQMRITIIFLLLGLFALTTCGTLCWSMVAESPVNVNLITSKSPASLNITLIDSNSITSHSYDFTIFGNSYTVVVVTNSELANLTMSETGLGIQFQANAPSGTTGFCNVTIPEAILVGTNIAVFENNVLLQKNVAYSLEHNGENYIFHLTFASGTHTFTIEVATTTSPTPSQGGIPIETVMTVVAVGAAAGISIAVLYSLKHVILGKLGGAAAGGGGGGGSNIPSTTGSGSAGVPAGTNITVNPHPNVQLTFNQVTQAGGATAIPLLSFPKPPGGIPFLGTVFDIKTTAVFTGLVLVGFLFDGTNLKEKDKKKLRVYRNDPEKGGVWEDVTSSIDTKNNIAYGATDHFSIFGVR